MTMMACVVKGEELTSTEDSMTPQQVSQKYGMYSVSDEDMLRIIRKLKR